MRGLVTSPRGPCYHGEKGSRHKNLLFVSPPRLFRKNVEGVATDIITTKYEDPKPVLWMGRVAVKSAIVQALGKAGITVNEYPEDTDKISRASAWINWASAGRVKLVGTEEQWAESMAQFVAFPNGAHDDAVDVVSGISQMLNLVINLPLPQNKERVEVIDPMVSMFR